MSERSLAIETATDICSVALAETGRPVAVLSLYQPRRHSEQLLLVVRSLLARAEWQLADLGYIAVSAGPGSYTGLRIGLSTAKGLCYASGARLVGVSSLEALGRRLFAAARPGDLLVPAFDARRGDIYAAIYRHDEHSMGVVEMPVASDAGAIAERLTSLPAGDLWLAGSGTDKLAAALPDERLTRRTETTPDATAVALVAWQRWQRGETEDLAAFEPYYLRKFVAKRPERSPFEKLPF
ncbi:MAG: tRNA (adenosine(37)-N6)-threonylcarbamoyltransferase complex dimerization subunit type 1 TsaB [Bacteroidota bacterium]